MNENSFGPSIMLNRTLFRSTIAWPTSLLCFFNSRIYVWVLCFSFGAPSNNRWLNFWVPVREESEDVASPREKDNGIDEEEFVGNIVLFWCIGFLILILHVLVVSAIEAYWLQAAKVLCALGLTRCTYPLMNGLSQTIYISTAFVFCSYRR